MRDNVILSTCNLKLKSHPGKLQPLYVGPFKVIQVVGHNVIKMDLPVPLRVHPVFNVLLLRQYMGYKMLPAPLAPDDKTENIVESIVQHCSRPRNF